MIAQLAKALHDRDKRIADPIAARHGRQYSLAAWEDTPEIARECWYDEARAALAAIREPNLTMQAAGNDQLVPALEQEWSIDVGEIWRAMLDAAFTEPAAKHD